MYPHHEESLKNLVNYFTTISDKKDDIIAIIFGGSVAKGRERADSDLDCMVILTDEKCEELRRNNITGECITGYCTYEGGYFDTKYYNKAFLKAVAEKGSEPARNAFVSSRCVYTKDEEIPELVAKIPVFQTKLKAEKMLSFYGGFRINVGYFWNMSKDKKDIFLRTKTVGEIVLYGLRMLLEENEVFFPCPKSLYLTVAALENKPENILEKADKMLENIYDEAAKDDFVNTLMDFLDYKVPEDSSIAYSRYLEDNELWWNKARPLVTEW